MIRLFVIFTFFVLSATPALASLVINEFVSDANPEWVEFYNTEDTVEYLKTYYLDDDLSFDSDAGSTAKKLLTNLVTSNSVYPYVEVSSMFNNDGDSVVLFAPDGTLIDQYAYTSSPGDDVSIGRSPDLNGSFFILSSSTKGAPNSTPLPSPTPTPPPPTDTPTPSKTPSPTKTPTPSRTPTPEVIPTNTPTVSSITSLVSSPKSPTKKPTPAVLGEETSESDPTINLDVVDATNQEAATPTGEPTEESRAGEREKEKGAILPLILIVIGGILTLGFGTPLTIQELRSRRKKA